MRFVIFGLAMLLIVAGCSQQPKDQNKSTLNGAGKLGADAMSVISIANGDTVKVEYIGKFTDGNVFDKSEGRGPLEFTVGAGNMIKGFDEAVVGMKLDEEKAVTIPPEKAYGTDEGQKITVQKSQIEGDGNFTIGSSIYTSQGQEFKIIGVDGNNVMLEFRHPLAGKTLIFWIKVVEINKAI